MLTQQTKLPAKQEDRKAREAKLAEEGFISEGVEKIRRRKKFH